jgi:hypothetical protein
MVTIEHREHSERARDGWGEERKKKINNEENK